MRLNSEEKADLLHQGNLSFLPDIQREKLVETITGKKA